MTERLTQISGRTICKVLTRLGFVFVSERGSHIKLRRMRGIVKEVIIVPDHKIVKKGTLSSILKKVNLRANDLKKLL